MLEIALAKKLIEQIVKYTEYNVNIMNKEGIIIASRTPDRIGTYHEPAWQILHGGKDIITVDSDSDYPGVSRGINMVIEIDGRREGVVGVTGSPEEIRPVALIIKMSIETMILYEHQKMQALRRQTKKEQLQGIILFEDNPDPTRLRELIQDIGCRPDIPRHCVLCRTKAAGRQAVLDLANASPLHQKEDILFLPDAEHILIFKSIPAESRQDDISSALAEHKAILTEYLDRIMEHRSAQDAGCRFYIGTMQNASSQYHAAYSQCKWLEKHIHRPETTIWFHDHLGGYLAQCIPYRRLQQVYGIYGDFLPENVRENFRKLIGSLIECDFNSAAAAKKSYMHKNTFAYQYSKLRKALGLTARSKPQDKWFLTYLYYYLTDFADENNVAL